MYQLAYRTAVDAPDLPIAPLPTSSPQAADPLDEEEVCHIVLPSRLLAMALFADV